MPVLRGPEKIGKSTAIKVLAMREEWFADEIADLGRRTPPKTSAASGSSSWPS